MNQTRSRGFLAAAALATAVTGLVLTQTATAAPSDPTPEPTPRVSAVAGAPMPRVVGYFTALTDVQRECLAGQGLQRPPGRLTEEQRDALRGDVDKALATCEITLPDRLLNRERLGFAFASLSTEQQQCLAEVHLTRPVGRLTPEQRALLRSAMVAAVEGCGITLR